MTDIRERQGIINYVRRQLDATGIDLASLQMTKWGDSRLTDDFTNWLLITQATNDAAGGWLNTRQKLTCLYRLCGRKLVLDKEGKPVLAYDGAPPKDRAMTNQEIAEIMGVSRRTIQRWINGVVQEYCFRILRIIQADL